MHNIDIILVYGGLRHVVTINTFYFVFCLITGSGEPSAAGADGITTHQDLLKPAVDRLHSG